MKREQYLLLVMLIVIVSIICVSQIYAQDEKAQFQTLYDELRISFEKADYSAALKNIESLRILMLELFEKKLASTETDPEFDQRFEQQQPSPAVLKLGAEPVKIHYGEKTFYAIDGDPNKQPVWARKSNLLYTKLPVEFKGKLAFQNRYVKIGTETKTVSFRSKTPDILTITEFGVLRINKQGNGIISVAIDDQQIDILLRAIKLPIRESMQDKEIISILGIPDKYVKQYIGWPESKIIDGIFYSANTDDVSGISVTHWHYHKYPGAILCMDHADRLEQVTQKAWAGLEYLYPMLENK